MKTLKLLVGESKEEKNKYLKKQDDAATINVSDHLDDITEIKTSFDIMDYETIYITDGIDRLARRIKLYHSIKKEMNVNVECVYFITPGAYIHVEPPLINYDCDSVRMITEPYFKPFNCENVRSILDLHHYTDQPEIQEEILLNFIEYNNTNNQLCSEYIDKMIDNAHHNLSSKPYILMGMFKNIGHGVCLQHNKDECGAEVIGANYFLNYLYCHDLHLNENTQNIVGAIFFSYRRLLLEEIEEKYPSKQLEDIKQMINEFDRST